MIKKIKSATIILEKSDGKVLLCKRSPNLSFFPGLTVFPGGKIEDKLPDNWTGEENEVKLTVLRELFEEVGILAGSTKIFDADERKRIDPLDIADRSVREEFKQSMVFVGRRQTPEFQSVVFDTAYYLLSGKIVDDLDAIPDGHEILEVMWETPSNILNLWEIGELFMPPPTTHTLRNLRDHRDQFESISLVETDLPIGLQTKIEFSIGYEGIPFRSNTIPPFFTTTLVVLNSENECLLVDPGAKPEVFDHLKLYLQSLNNIPKIFLTHHHKDHWEALTLIEELYPQTEIFGHPNTLNKISTSLNKIPISDGIMKIGMKQLSVIHTPGHTDGHLCLFDTEKNILIAGDHVVGKGSAVLGLADGDMKQYLESTYKLKQLGPTIIVPAHGPPSFSGENLLQSYIDHRLKRESDILNAINNGADTLEKILRVVYTDVPESMWEFAKSNIILHVRKLHQENKTNLQFTLN